MKNTKIALGVVIVLLGIVLLLQYWQPIASRMFYEKAKTLLSDESRTPRTYKAENGFSFSYPASYTLEERSLTINSADVKLITLPTKMTPGQMEGGTAITITIFDNVKKLPLEAWLAANRGAGIPEAPVYEKTSVAEKSAVAYQASGLYESDNVALEHDGRIYLFSVTWMTRDDQILADFKEVLASVSFIQ